MKGIETWFPSSPTHIIIKIVYTLNIQHEFIIEYNSEHSLLLGKEIQIEHIQIVIHGHVTHYRDPYCFQVSYCRNVSPNGPLTKI